MASNDASTKEGAASRASSVGADHRDPDADSVEQLRITSIYSSLSSLLMSDRFSDMTIRCGGRVFKAHRAIVCSQSPFFDKALTGGFSVSLPALMPADVLTRAQEAASQVVDLPEDDPDVLERFLQFLYTGTYAEMAYSITTGPDNVCRMSPDEIQDELRTLPGVRVTLDPPGSTATHESDSEGDSTRTEVGTDAETAPDPPGAAATHEAEGDSSRAEDGAESDTSNYSDEVFENPGEPPEEFELSDERDPEPSADAAERREPQPWEPGYEERLRELRMRHDMFLPLRLYVMADKFGVPALKLLARDRFYRAAELAWRDSDVFPAVVDELYTTTPPTDVAMRDIVCRLVGLEIRQDALRERMADVMRTHGDFAVGVMNYMIALEKVHWF